MALTLVRDLGPDLIIMDIKMPLCDGLEATRLIHAQWPAARTVMLTVHDEDEKLFEAIKAGASGYRLKDTSSSEFLRGMRSVLAGEAVLPPKLAAHLISEFARLANQPHNAASSHASELTQREREVLMLIAQGDSDKEIAFKLSLSLYTIKSHVRNILGKLHADNRRAAANLGIQQGLIRD